MTRPDIDPYPDEIEKLTAVSDRLAAQFEFTHFTETNKRIFDMAAHNEFGDAGFSIEVDWKEIFKNERPTGVWLPHVAITGRNKVETETDHDRVKWGVVKGLADGQPGYIREDGSKHEEPRKKDISMTDSQKTLIAALLDRSGSMIDSKEATEEGWRGLIADQAKQPGRCQVTLAQFDTSYDMLYSNLPINQLPKFEVQPRWGTALLDATGKFVTEIGAKLANIPEDDRPGKVICLIMTDGMENSSVEWTLEGVKKLIEQQREQWKWEFIFMGANIDAVEVAASMGIARGSSITYDAANPTANIGTYAAASGLMTNSRSGLAPEANVFSEKDRDQAMGKKSKKAKTTTP